MLHWYTEQLKEHKALSVKVLVASFMSSVILETVMPYCIATICELIGRKARLGEFAVPTVTLALCVAVLCVAILYRQSRRRALQMRGHDSFVEKINEIIASSPSLSLNTSRASVAGSTNEFFDAWEKFLYVVGESLIPLIAGVVGLGIVLGIKAPIALIPFVLLLTVALLLARKIGRTVDQAWKNYQDRENDERTILTELAASSQMLWLVRILTRIRKKATAKRSQTMDEYVQSMIRSNAFQYLLTYGFRVAAAVAGVLLATLFGVSVVIVLLLLLYAMTFGDRLGSIFSLNEMIRNALTRADKLVRLFAEQEHPRPVLYVADATVCVSGLVVELGKNADGAPKTILRWPSRDFVFKPGVRLLTGPSGCGKTTLLRVFNGCQSYAEGTVTIGGFDVSQYDVRSIAFYGQQAYDPLDETLRTMFGGDEVDIVARDQALNCAAYPDAPLDRQVNTLSGGQRRRFFMALLFYQVLSRGVDEPSVLSLDEPTNDLDPESIEGIVKGISWIAANYPKLVIVVVTHDTRLYAIPFCEIIEA